jgi:hypothetical protein
MIRLRDMLSEITLGHVEPYALQFVWSDADGDDEYYESSFKADTQTIILSMLRDATPGSWNFTYFVRGADNQGWTTNAAASSARGQTRVFRLLKTVGYAIRDFADAHSDVKVIDISGADSAAGKSAQKTRIYAELLRANPELHSFRVRDTGDTLQLIRKSSAANTEFDATGIA